MSWTLPPPSSVVIKIGSYAAKKITSSKFKNSRNSFDHSIKEDLPDPQRWKLDRTDFKCVDSTKEGLIIARFAANASRVFCIVDYSGPTNETANVYISDVAFGHAPKEREECVVRVSRMKIEDLDGWGSTGPDAASSRPPPEFSPGDYTDIPEDISNLDYDRIVEWAANEDIRLVLTPEQGEIIFDKSPILINGQAGTGKSTMIAYRMAIMLDEYYLEKECQQCFGSEYTGCPECDGTRVAITQQETVAKDRRILMTCYSPTLVDQIKDWTGKVLTNLDFIRFPSGEGSFLCGSRRGIDIENAPIDFIPFPELAKSFLPASRRDESGHEIPGRIEHFRSEWDRVSFARFRRDFYNRQKSKKYPAEYVWHSIRTYIKGMADGGEKTYLDFEDYQNHPEIRDNYEENQWQDMLNIARSYERFLSKKKLWDDLDLAQEALRSIKKDLHRYCKHCKGFEKELFTDSRTEAFGSPSTGHKGRKAKLSRRRRGVTFQNSRWVNNCDYCDDDGKIDRPKYWGYNEVYLDEAQDLTRVEFELLKQLMGPKPNVAVEEGQYPLVFAGDPNQTVNPTGFNWRHIVQLIWQGKKTEVNQLTTNHRSHARIVALSNMIQRRRREYLRPADAGEYVSCNECQGQGTVDEESCTECDGDGKVTINLQDSPDKMDYDPINHTPMAYCLQSGDNIEISEFIDTVTEHSLGVRFLIAHEDFHETIKFLEEDSVFGKKIKSRYPSKLGYGSILDDILEALKDKSGTGTVLLDGNEAEPDLALAFIMEKFNITSISSIKGHEYEAVVIYNFSSHPDFKKWTKHTLHKLEFKDLAYISLMFHLNRLYISTTRPRDHLILIDQEDDLWMDESLAEIIDNTYWGDAAMLRVHPLFDGLTSQSPYESGMMWFNAGVKENDMTALYRAKSKFTDSDDQEAKNKISEIDARVAMSTRDWAKAGDSWSRVMGRNADAAECYEKADDYSKASKFYRLCYEKAPTDSDERRDLEAKYHKNAMKDSDLSQEERKNISLDFFKFASSDENLKFVDEKDLPRLASNLDHLEEHSKAFWVRTEILHDPDSQKAAIRKYMELGKHEQVRSYIEKNELRQEYNGEYIECLSTIADKRIQKGEIRDAAGLYSTAGEFDDTSYAQENYEKAGDLYAEYALTSKEKRDWASAAVCYSKGKHPSTGSNGFISSAKSAPRAVERITNFSKSLEHYDSTIKPPLDELYTRPYIHEEIIKCGDDRTSLYRNPKSLRQVVNSSIVLKRFDSARSLVDTAKKKAKEERPEQLNEVLIVSAELYVARQKYPEAVKEYIKGGATKRATALAKKHEVPIDSKRLVMIKAEDIIAQYENSKKKNPVLALKVHNLLKKDNPHEAAKWLDKAINAEALFTTKIDMILEHVSDCNKAINQAIRVIDGYDSPVEEKYDVILNLIQYMLEKLKSDQFQSGKINLLHKAAPWLKSEEIKRHYSEPEDYVNILILLDDAFEVIDYYEGNRNHNPKWSVRGSYEWADRAIEECRRRLNQPKGAVWAGEEDKIQKQKVEWARMLKEDIFDTPKGERNQMGGEAMGQLHTKDELKEMCRDRGLKISGNKSELIERITSADSVSTKK